MNGIPLGSSTPRILGAILTRLPRGLLTRIAVGNHSVSGGNTVIAARTPSSEISHGRIARAVTSKRMSAMRVTTNSSTPIGGVMVPDDQVQHHHHAELHGVDAFACCRGREDRDQDQHRGQCFHEAANDAPMQRLAHNRINPLSEITP